jgi:hypothetical protein
MQSRRRKQRYSSALCAAQQVRCCAGGRGVGAAGCYAQRTRSGASLHVAPRCCDVKEARRREWRSGGALCAAQQVCCCVGGRGGGAGGGGAARSPSAAP